MPPLSQQPRMPNLVVQFLAVAFWFNSTSLSLSKPRLLGIQYLILLCNKMQMTWFVHRTVRMSRIF